jgi:type IV secretory pathway VirB4 component
MDDATLVQLYRGLNDKPTTPLNPSHVHGLRRVADAVAESTFQHIAQGRPKLSKADILRAYRNQTAGDIVYVNSLHLESVTRVASAAHAEALRNIRFSRDKNHRRVVTLAKSLN